MISVLRNPNVISDLVISEPESAADSYCETLPTKQNVPADDLDLQGRVLAFLADSHMPGLRQLRVEARNGIVTVSGRVKTFYEKQVGGQRTRRVAGVIRLVDRIEVATT